MALHLDRQLRAKLAAQPANQSKLEPFPVTVNISEPNVTQPIELGGDIEKDVAWVLVVGSDADTAQKPFVQPRRGRCNMFQIAENTARGETVVYLGVKCALSLIGTMMNRKAGHNCIVWRVSRERIIEVVFANRNAQVAGKPVGCGRNHRGRKVQTDEFSIGTLFMQESEQTPTAGAKVEDASGARRYERKQDRLALGAVRDSASSGEIRQSVFRRLVFVVSHEPTLLQG